VEIKLEYETAAYNVYNIEPCVVPTPEGENSCTYIEDETVKIEASAITSPPRSNKHCKSTVDSE